MDELLIEYIKANIKDRNLTFVFPTDVAVKGWADWIVKNSDITGVKAVEMKRFIAWDDFKGAHISSENKELESIPSLMRKVFASYIIEKNAQCVQEGKPPLFTSLIAPKYAKTASSFAEWIAKILPSLQLWRDYHESEGYKKLAREKQIDSNDAEDKDYEMLYTQYSAFLKEHNRFEPAWEKPPFRAEENQRFCIVYPEILQDWTQYKELLESAEQIDLLRVSTHTKPIEYESTHYETSIQEIRDVALMLKEKADSGLKWTDMTVSVPNMDNYASQIERTFTQYNIPFTMRYSKTLTSYLAGNVFEQIQNCQSENFSFDSLRRLLLNDAIPWKEQKKINALISFGQKNNCVCSYGDVDSWEEAFRNPVHDKTISLEDAVKKYSYLRGFYESLRDTIRRLVMASSFAEIKKAYNEFRFKFFDVDGFAELPTSDKIISRCVKELYKLIELSDEFGINKEAGSIHIPNCYGFFVKHLSVTEYLEQLTENAVQIYPYRTSTAAPYKLHVVVDSTQDALSVSTMFKQLSFLSDEKRKLILELNAVIDLDPTQDFIKLYAINSEEKAYFSSSHHSTSGYGFPHGLLENTKIPSKENKLTLRYDPITAERYFLLGKEIAEGETSRFDKPKDAKSAFPHTMLDIQKKGFEQWAKMHTQTQEKRIDDKTVREAINAYKDEKSGRYKISQSAIKAFFECPRKWLFEKVLKLAPNDNAAEIIDEFLMGNINHFILEKYTRALQEKKLPLTAKDEYSLDDEYKAILHKSIEDVFAALLKEGENKGVDFEKNTLSTMAKTVIDVQRYTIEDTLERSIAALSFNEKIKGSFVVAVEHTCELYSPEGENYSIVGKIDCILRNGEDIILLDYKTSKTPDRLYLKQCKTGEEPDFQMPYYTTLYENEMNENVCAAYFYSIKKKELKPVFDWRDVSDDKRNLSIEQLRETAEIEREAKKAKQKKDAKTEPKTEYDAIIDFIETKAHCLEQTKVFAKALESMSFGIAPNASEKCVSKDDFGKGCIDYVAVCRMFFTVSGENGEKE